MHRQPGWLLRAWAPLIPTTSSNSSTENLSIDLGIQKLVLFHKWVVSQNLFLVIYKMLYRKLVAELNAKVGFRSMSAICILEFLGIKTIFSSKTSEWINQELNLLLWQDTGLRQIIFLSADCISVVNSSLMHWTSCFPYVASLFNVAFGWCLGLQDCWWLPCIFLALKIKKCCGKCLFLIPRHLNRSSDYSPCRKLWGAVTAGLQQWGWCCCQTHGLPLTDTRKVLTQESQKQSV